MKIIIRLVLLVALVAVVIWLWGILFPSPEKLIRKQLAEVARYRIVRIQRRAARPHAERRETCRLL